MKTKIIPFDLEMAKKIQAGEIEGKIKTRDLETTMNIVCYDSTARYCDTLQPIIAQNIEDCDDFHAYYKNGAYMDEGANPQDLVLEVPDEPQFKPFDKVLVRKNGFDKWKANFFSHMDNGYYKCVNSRYKECVLFEGNEHLIGTTDKPKED